MKAMDMKSRIELELRGKEASSIKELNLDSCRAQQLDGLTDDFQNLEILSLINVGLTSLKGFPKLPNLKKLELSDNRLSGSLDNLIGCQKLTHLNLSGNKFKEIESLAALAKLQSLTNLDLFNCEVTQVESYRDKIFKLLPNLKYLDGFDQNEQEEDEFEGENESDDDDDEEDDDEEDDDEDDDEEDEDEEEEAGEKVNGQNGVKKNGDANSEEEDDDDDDEDDDENEVGLSYLQKSNLEDDEDDEDFDEAKAMKLAQMEEEEEDDDEEEVDENEVQQENVSSTRSRKRKHDETGDEDSKTN